MVATRASRRKKLVVEEEKVENKQAASPAVVHHDDENAEPKPISSSEEEESTTTTTTTALLNKNIPPPLKGMSRLFAPYCSLGIISNGRPYCLSHHGDSSQTSFCTLPIGNRFQIYQLDKLQPVLVSRPCNGDISHVETDASLGITVASHDDNRLTLYSRTRPIDTLKLTSSKQYSAVDMLHLGRVLIPMDGEKEGKLENAAVICVILSKLQEESNNKNNDVVPVVGHDDDSSSDEDSSDDNSSSLDSDVDSADIDCSGQVVLILASRNSLSLQNRTLLVDSPPTVALHPSTYLNKIVIGFQNKLSLINVRTSKVIYNFKCITQEEITALEQSPAVDTIAVGTMTGNVHLANIKHDTLLFSFQHEGTKITSLSFRTDGSALKYGVAPLAVGRSDGTISIWDLQPNAEQQERTLLCEMKHVHIGGVAKLSFMPQEPLLISTGMYSNSLQAHVFDSPDHSARLLRQRSGHTAPPHLVKYKHGSTALLHQSLSDGTDAAACQILSASQDQTLRVFSSARSVLDKEYSQGRGLVKKAKLLNIPKHELLLKPILDIATCEAKTRDWGDVVSIHKDHAMAYVWSTRRGAQSGPLLKQKEWNVSAMQVPPPKSTHATSVCISACGNYCLVGTVGGVIYKYNVQSGIPRGSYPNNSKKETKQRRNVQAGNVDRTMRALEKKSLLSNRPFDKDKMERDEVLQAKNEAAQQQKLLLASHNGFEVTGLAVDSLNKTVLSVGMDAKLILWNFTTRAPHKKSPYKLPKPATKLCHVRDNDLAAIALEDYTVVLFDCSAQSIVRRFGSNNNGHSGPISDLDLAPDGRSLFTSSLDGTVRVWDVPTNSCVDWLGFRTPPTSLTVSPTGEFIATTHADQLGISMWSDKSFYQTVHVDGSHPPTEPARMDDPVPLAEENDGDMARDVAQKPQASKLAGNDDKQQQMDSSKVAPAAKEDGLITMSGLPPAHWKNLFHLELVKERNKPKEAPKKPPSAPFFLQWRGGDNSTGDPSSKSGNAGKEAAGENDEWAAAWSDDDDAEKTQNDTKKRVAAGDNETSLVVKTDNDWMVTKAKKRKVTHSRSHLAALLEDSQNRACSHGLRFQGVTEHMATLGPSAIDVAFSTLCHGMHDLDEGLPLLHLTSMWLLEACESRQRYEAINAYLHRFLYIHSNVIAGVDDSVKQDTTSEQQQTEEERNEKEQERQQRLRLLDTIAQLRVAQRSASDALKAKMQHSLCLLRHFSRMV